jgi:hypothetical protein
MHFFYCPEKIKWDRREGTRERTVLEIQFVALSDATGFLYRDCRFPFFFFFFFKERCVCVVLINNF